MIYYTKLESTSQSGNNYKKKNTAFKIIYFNLTGSSSIIQFHEKCIF